MAGERLRNPKRIHPILAKVAEIWYQNPDLRLGQVLTILKDMGVDFNTEDDVNLKLLNDYLVKSHQPNPNPKPKAQYDKWSEQSERWRTRGKRG